MKLGMAVLFLAFSLLLPTVRADDLDASVDVHLQDQTSSVDLDKYGKGKEDVKIPDFTVQLVNNGMDDLADVELKLYVVVAPNWLPSQTAPKGKPRVLRVLDQKSLHVGAMQSLSVPMGKVEIKSAITADPTKRNETWYIGSSYAGYVLEIYLNGKLSQTKMTGSTAVRPAYENYLKKHGGKETE
jgi:hypothetical protein